VTVVRRLLHALLRLAAGSTLLALHGSTPPTGEPVPPPQHSGITIPSPPYLWPTDAGTVVTSTFGEYRSTHFHAGIDISTGDDTGYRVFAVLDGDVRRVTITATGYGKILRLRHADGTMTGYAHLRGFAPAIEARVHAEQQRLGRYPIDLRFAPGEFPVRRGDVIGYSGDTGIGTPHLHFEVADTGGYPLNPLLVLRGALADALSPLPTRIAVVPLGAGSEVDGGWEPKVYSVRPAGRGQGIVRERVTIAGSAGFLVEARDPAPGTRFLRGVFRYRLLVDEREVYTVTMGRLPRPYPYQVELHYDRSIRHDGRGRFERLFSFAGPALPIGVPSAAGAGAVGMPNLAPGLHRFTIIAEDIAGNSSRIAGEFRYSGPLRHDVDSAWIPLQRSEEAQGLRLEATADGELVTVLLSASEPLDRPPIVGVIEGPTSRAFPAREAGVNRFVVRFAPGDAWSGTRRIEARGTSHGRPVSGATEISLYPIDPDAPGALTLWGGELRLTWDAGAVYRRVFFQSERSDGPDGRQYLLQPEATVVRSRVRVMLRPPGVDSTEGLYFRGRGRWVLLGRHAGGSWQGELQERFGAVAVLPDDTAPEVYQLRITGGARPRIAFRFRDDRAGVDYGEAKLYIDMMAVIPELDGEHRRAVYQAHERLAPGTHEVVIRLADNMGNTRSVRRTFSVP
jgi:hypothetical protein